MTQPIGRFCRLLLVAVLATLAESAPAEPTEAISETAPPNQPAVYMGRTIAAPMSYSGADWLVRKSRKREENPQKLLEVLAIAPGETVCDFGCGNGYHAVELAKRVGPRGVVYAVDVQREMLDLLAQRTQSRGLKNVVPLLAEPQRSGLPRGKVDLVLMVDVYHELADPVASLKDVAAALAPEGRIAVVEFREEDPEVPIRPLHKMSKRQVHAEFTANGFKLVGQNDDLPWQHVMFYSRQEAKATQ